MSNDVSKSYIDERFGKSREVIIEYTDEEAKRFGLSYKYEGDAGFDLHVILDEEDRKEGLKVYPGERKKLAAGFKMQLPEGWWARITHRSSTEKRYRLRVVEGTIDQGYRGHLFTQVANDNSFPVVIHHGDRIAQMILHERKGAEFVEGTVDSSDRGEKGFGSSGR